MSETDGHRPPRSRAPVRDPELALLALAAGLEGQQARQGVEPLLPLDDAEFLWAVVEVAASLCPALLTGETRDQLAAAITHLRSPII